MVFETLHQALFLSPFLSFAGDVTQILTENMLEVGDGVKLDIHTADYLYDYLSASSTGCPALRALSQAAFDSAEWNE